MTIIVNKNLIAKAQANAIFNGQTKTLEQHRKYSKTADENLEMAKIAHDKLKTTIKPEDKERVRLYNEAIDKYHTEATKHAYDLNEELNKTTPEVSIAKSHAKQFYNSINNAEKEHQGLIKKLKNPAIKKP
jgi:phage-related tail protein